MSRVPTNARPDALALAVHTLYALAAQTAGLPVPGGKLGASLAGHKFEDASAKAVYEALVHVGITPFRPRHSLKLPTLSGLPQEFDVVIPNGPRYLIVELKHRPHSEIEQLYAFTAKLLDYALASRLHATGHLFTGLFVSTAGRLNNNFRQYALAYGIIPIAPDLPPCQVLASQASHPALRQDAANIALAIDNPLPTVALNRTRRSSPDILLKSWQAVAQRQAQTYE